MGARVTAATHLGTLLTRLTPRPAPGIAKIQALASNLAAARAANAESLAAASNDPPGGADSGE